MTKLLIGIGIIAGGLIGWWIAVKLGLGTFGQFFISNLGSIVGIFAGWKIAQEYF